MIIGVDGNEANVEKKVGVSVYTFELLHYFREHADKESQYIIYLRTLPREDMPLENSFFKYRVVNGKRLWSQLFLPLHLLLKRDVDVFFCPAHYAPRFCPVPTVVTIHDLAYFYYPDEFLKKDLYQLKNWTGYSITQAKKLIAVSKTTKKDISKFYTYPSEEITVVYNGFRAEKKSSTLSDEDKKIFSDITSRPYFLYAGTIQPRKNISTLLEAFSEIIKTNPEIRLVLVGRKGWLYEKIYQKVEELQLQDHVIFTGYVTDALLDHLYKKALSFVLPSFYEGFGIPILEAMSRECPVISSFTSSLSEIGGDACLYFDPENKNDITDKMMTMLGNPKLKQELVKKGLERVKLFSWQKCGEETLVVIRSAVK